MASMIITKEEFADYIIMFLLEKMINSDNILPGHEEFNELMDNLASKGVRQQMLFYYFNTEPTIRSKFKSSKKVFKEGSKESLNIVSKGKVEGEEKPTDTGIVKDLIKKALKIIKAHRKKSGFPLNEEKVDKILDRLLEKEGYITRSKE